MTRKASVAHCYYTPLIGCVIWPIDSCCCKFFLTKNISAEFCTVSTDTAHHVVLRQYISCDV